MIAEGIDDRCACVGLKAGYFDESNVSTTKTTKWLYCKTGPHCDPFISFYPPAYKFRFQVRLHESLPALQGHLSKERARAFPHFFRRKVFFVGCQVPLVTERISELPPSIAPEHIRHRHIRFRTG
jgi:hypothetical protein